MSPITLYLHNIETLLQEAGFPAELLVMQSGGGGEPGHVLRLLPGLLDAEFQPQPVEQRPAG